MPAPKTPIVFIHGLWMHSDSWTPWLEYFDRAGFAPIAPGWPGDGRDPAATRANAEALNNRGIAEVTEHYAKYIADLPAPPIVIGHSFGGLIAQQLLAQGIAIGGIAIAPAQYRGVYVLPPAQLRSVGGILAKPWLRRKTWAHTADSYHRVFGNAISRAESDQLFRQYAIPAPAKPVFQLALANVSPGSEVSVDVHAVRGPLLLIAGAEDRATPPAVVRAQFRLQQRNPGVTELQVLNGRGHSMVADHCWHNLADLSLAFLSSHKLGPEE
ncbi:alpha/beta fold hydrolase [Nocardia sp. NPDC006630]|uniref:alpha/beta hydrolase n=1 Tax=Nocardia sp. NPDC006630 TaxID=3157181 RepID=UPI0033A879DB